MRPFPPRRHLRVQALAMVASSFFLAASSGAQGKSGPTLEDRISRTGVFFRADAPAVLRNNQDPSLPVFLEIINGVEKTGLSSVARLARQVTRDPVELEGVRIYVKPAGAKRRFAEDPLRLGESAEFTFDARIKGKPLAIADRMEKTLEIPLEVLTAYLERHYIGGPFDVADLRVSFVVRDWPPQDSYLRVRLAALPLPRLPHWYRGDVHYHSGFTDNPAERGYPLGVTKQAALQADLNWIVLTDHSTDLNPERYAEEQREAARYRDGRFLYIVGEEVSAASGKEGSAETLHVLALPSPDDPGKGFPDPANPASAVIVSGEGSATSPAQPLAEVLERIGRAGGFAFAAHPHDPISPLLRGGSWDLDADFLGPRLGGQLRAGLAGLEPWNRGTSATADDARDPFCVRPDAPPDSCFKPDPEANQYARLEKGMALGWLPLLRKGLAPAAGKPDAPGFKVFMAAGSDAHGDFNYQSTLDVVDFLSHSLRRLTGYAEDNALGKITMVVDCPQGMGAHGEHVLVALREGQSVMSNGPLLIAGFDLDSSGLLDDPQDARLGGQVAFAANQIPQLQLSWMTSDEFGPFTSIRVIAGTSERESPPVEVQIPSAMTLTSGGLYPLNLRNAMVKLRGAWGYLRLEARTRNKQGEEFRCYTNPIWVRVVEP